MASQNKLFCDQFRGHELSTEPNDTGGPSTSDFLKLFDRETHYFRPLYEKGSLPVGNKKIALDKELNFESYLDYLTKLNKDGYGIFYMPNTTDGRGGADENIVEIKALFLDLDSAPLGPVLQAGLTPTAVIETSPGRFHVYFFLKDHLPVQDFKKYQQALARRFNGDESICNPSRLMRAPGFLHNKGKPLLSTIKQLNPDARYTADEIVKGLKLDLSFKKKKQSPTADKVEKIFEGKRNTSIFKKAVSLFNTGLPESSVGAAMKDYNVKACEPPLDDGEIVSIVESAYKTTAQGSLQMQSFQELINAEIPPVHWIVKGLLPQGLTILAGAPKVGKSWMSLELALRVANGEPVFGFYEVTKKRNVLYFALEDSENRLQERIKLIAGGGDIPINAKIVYEWKADQKGLDVLRRAITQDKIDFVIIDTFAAANMEPRDGYKADYRSVRSIQQIAVETGACIVLVHHTRKTDRKQTSGNIDQIEEVNGTMGLNGAADSIIILRKPPKVNVFNFYIKGRDVEETTIPLVFEDYRWTVSGDMADLLSNENEIKIYKAINTQPLGPNKLSDLTQVNPNTTKTICRRLEHRGLISNFDGKYIRNTQPLNRDCYS